MPELINIGVSALISNQRNLTTTGHNIANADTPGYSRQQALSVTTPPQPTAVGFEGSGVTVQGIRRMVDQFAIAELRLTGDGVNRLERLLANSEQLDNMLGDDATGLSPILQRFFSSLQTASEDPASIASRQVVVTSAELLTNRINELYARLEAQNTAINTQFQTLTNQATTLSAGVAELNERISIYANVPSSRLPNDLLDERDRILQELSEIMNVQVLENDDRSINVYVGNGQSLVVGNRSFELYTTAGADDATRNDIQYRNGDTIQTITDQVTGGKIGGLLQFRNNVLDETYSQLGIVALGLTESVNNQHRLGMDLDGQIGGDFFRDLNNRSWALSRVSADSGNGDPGSEVILANITSVTEMTTSDYLLRFSPSTTNQYTVVRQSDGEQVFSGAFSDTFPVTMAFDGVEIVIEEGNFSPGDAYLITPARFAAREMALNVRNTRDLAFAQPIRVEGSEANRGTGTVTQGQVVDTTAQIFSEVNSNGNLNPPLLVQFTSGTRYHVLDNSDPTNPVPMVPPLMNLTYVPGVTNSVLPADDNQLTVTSDGAAINTVLRNTVLGTFNNGYGAEALVVTSVDPDTGVISRQTLNTTAGDSAALTATALSGFDNTSASARNYVLLDEINSTSPMAFTLNGQTFAISNPATLAIQINSNSSLTAAGISARSNGSQVEIESTVGEDFQIEIAGGAGDNMTISGRNGAPVVVSGADPVPEVTVGGYIDVVFDSGTTMTGVSSVFTTLPTHYPRFLGIQVDIGGSPSAGDVFEINYNRNGFSDNRNIVALGALQTEKILQNGEATIRDTYANLINFVGTQTNEADLSYEAAKTLYDRAVSEREAVSGVNLDEEAGNVIKYEQAYNASAQLIAVARSIFDVLLNSVG